MNRKIRKPTQKRSLEKYNKIIESAFKLFNENGYYNTTTADIAKEANVATGSVYSYFEDKKDIFIQVVKKIDESFDYPTKTFWAKNSKKDLTNYDVFKTLINQFLKLMIRYHNFSNTYNNDMEALKLLDEDIRNLKFKLYARRMEIIRQTLNVLPYSYKSVKDMDTFIYYLYMLMDNLCHKIVYDPEFEDRDIYTDKCTKMLYVLFKDSIK
ncbi:TetR/AcrR family transcriptional regulator [Clostridium tyrobutyricum]|jgi:Transcriptional regulator|uniref:TetR/AcrR family transcriptional regulator n=1 Tax=Clostridium tyrobutyricum TaxID=1519 RepID=UPI001C38210B|nr:TetR/AcrR family transcriptional regulator [Clostridium tyrobutyricum]MBV4430963.1 TetR/AcrR family transcriptional regulator [Clostridium tyrobutyricum]